MNTLLKGVLFFVGSVIFVNIVLFDILRMPRQTMSFGSLFLIQISAMAFMAFIYFVAVKKN